MSEVRLSAELRTEFGKGFARRTRQAGKIPAVIYGHGAEPRHVALSAREFATAIRNGGANVLLTLDIEGTEQLVIPKSIQRHPIKPQIEHLDLLAVRRGEKVTIDVPLEIVGDVVAGGLMAQESTSVSIEAEATNLPTGIELSIADLAIGTQVKAADLALTAGSSLAGDPEQILVVIQAAPTAEEIDAEVAGAAEELGMVEDAPQSESDSPAE